MPDPRDELTVRAAAPSTSTTKYPPDFPATVTKDLMQHSVAAPTPLTDALSKGHYQSVPIEVAYGEMFEHARDLERKLVEAQRDAERYRWAREQSEDTLLYFYLELYPNHTPSEFDFAIDEAMRGKP